MSPISVLDENTDSEAASGQYFLEPTTEKVMDDAGGLGGGFSIYDDSIHTNCSRSKSALLIMLLVYPTA